MCARLTDRALRLNDRAPAAPIRLKQCAPETALHCASGRSSLQFATHKERWAERHAELRDVVRSTTGEEQERAKQAVRDHYETQAYPQTSRAALIEQARLNYDKRAAEETGTA